MKRPLALLLVLALLFAGCGASEPAPAPESMPPESAVSSASPEKEVPDIAPSDPPAAYLSGEGDCELLPGYSEFLGDRPVHAAAVGENFYFACYDADWKPCLLEFGPDGAQLARFDAPEEDHIVRLKQAGGRLVLLTYRKARLFDADLNLLTEIPVPEEVSATFDADMGSYDVTGNLSLFFYQEPGVGFSGGKLASNGRKPGATLLDPETGESRCLGTDYGACRVLEPQNRLLVYHDGGSATVDFDGGNLRALDFPITDFVAAKCDFPDGRMALYGEQLRDEHGIPEGGRYTGVFDFSREEFIPLHFVHYRDKYRAEQALGNGFLYCFSSPEGDLQRIHVETGEVEPTGGRVRTAEPVEFLAVNSREQILYQALGPMDGDPDVLLPAGFFLTKDAEPAAVDSDLRPAGIQTLTYAEALADPSFGGFIPQELPEGFSMREAHRDGDFLFISFEQPVGNTDYRELVLSTARAEPDDAKRTVDADAVESYDVHLYEIPWADSVPGEYLDTFDHPLFRAEDLSPQVIARRVYDHRETGDEHVAADFEVLSGDGKTVLRVMARNIDAAALFGLLESLPALPGPPDGAE